jgi:hypothetical protein
LPLTNHRQLRCFSSLKFLSPERVINGLWFSISDFFKLQTQHLVLPPYPLNRLFPKAHQYP